MKVTSFRRLGNGDALAFRWRRAKRVRFAIFYTDAFFLRPHSYLHSLSWLLFFFFTHLYIAVHGIGVFPTFNSKCSFMYVLYIMRVRSVLERTGKHRGGASLFCGCVCVRACMYFFFEIYVCVSFFLFVMYIIFIVICVAWLLGLGCRFKRYTYNTYILGYIAILWLSAIVATLSCFSF